MKPKGHKRGCKCVVCSPRRKPARRNAGYERQADVALHNRPDRAGRRTNIRRNSTVIIPGTTRSRNAAGELSMHRARRGNPSAERGDPDNLLLYAFNTGELYPMIEGTRKSLMAKRARGQYVDTLAEKAWLNVMNRAAQMYTREMRTSRPYGSYGEFSKSDRWVAAHKATVDFEDEAKTGAYDYLLPKKYQNPISHFPRTTRGPKGNVKWYILDLYDGRGNLVSSRYRKCARAKCATEAAGLVNRKVGKKMVRKVELSGPYGRKPNAKTTRK